MAMSPEHSSKFVDFTGNGDVSIYVKNLEWDDKPQVYKQYYFRAVAVARSIRGFASYTAGRVFESQPQQT